MLLTPLVAHGALPPGHETGAALQTTGLLGDAVGLELPAGVTYASLGDLSCAAPGECVMVGLYRPTSASVHTDTNPQTGFVVVQSGGEWGEVSELPGLEALDVARRGSVGRVECPEVGQCTAVGTYGYIDDWNGAPWIRNRNFVATLEAGQWSVADLADAPFETIGALACPAHGECIIGGGALNNRAFVIIQSGGVWGAAQLIDFVGDQGSTTTPSVTDIACTAPGNCTVIGEIGSGSSRRGFAVDVRNGVLQTAVNAYGGNETAKTVELRDVACHGDVCSAVGRGGIPLPLWTQPGQAKVDTGNGIELASVNRLTADTAPSVVAALNARMTSPALSVTTDNTSGAEVTVLDGLMVAYGDSTRTVRIPVSEVLHIESRDLTMLVASAGAADIPIKLGTQDQVRLVNNGIVAIAAAGLPQSAEGEVFSWGSQTSHLRGLARLASDVQGVLVQQFVIDAQTRNNLSTNVQQLVIAVGGTRVVFGAESNSVFPVDQNIVSVTNPAAGTPLARFGRVTSAVRPGTVLMTVDGVTRPASIRLLNGTGGAPPQTTRGSHAVPLLDRFNALAAPAAGANAMQFNPSSGSNLEGLLVNPENSGETSRPRGDGVFVIHPGTTAPNSTTAADLDVLVFLAMATRESSADPLSNIRAYNQNSGTTPLLVRQSGRPAFLAVGAVGLSQGPGRIEIMHGRQAVDEAMSPLRSQATFDTASTAGVLLDQFELDLGTSSATNLATNAQTMVLTSGNVTIAFQVNLSTSGSYSHHTSGYAARVSERRGALTIDRGNPATAVNRVELDAPPTLPVVTSRTASNWTSVVLDDTPRQSGSSDGPILRHLDCTSAGNCVGAGFFGFQGEPRRAFLTEQIDGIWQPTSLVNWPTEFGEPVSIEAVNCAGPGECIVFGQNKWPGGSVIQRPFVLEQRSGVWGDVLELPGPWDDMETEVSAAAGLLECVAGQCIAAGTFSSSSLLYVTPFSSTGGTTTPVILPPPPPSTTEAPADTVAPATTVPTPTTTVPPVTQAPRPVPTADGTPPELEPGAVDVVQAGSPVAVELVVENEQRDLVLRSTEFQLRLSGECSFACSIATDAAGRQVIELEDTGSVRVTGAGFRPGSLIDVWLFSEPVLLGQLTVASDGTFTGSLPVVGLEPGSHTLQVSGQSVDGEVRAVSLGVVVAAPGVPTPRPTVLPSTGVDLGLVAWMTGLVVVGTLMVTSGRRRKLAR